MADQASSDKPGKDYDVEEMRRAHDVKIQATKKELAVWAEANTKPGNHGTITLAFIELGIERQLEAFPKEKWARDLVEGVLKKVLQRRNGSE